MKYLYCALLLCGAFFSNYSFADPTGFPDNSHLCEPGETFIAGFGPDGMGACAIVAPENSCDLKTIRHNSSVFNSVQELNSYFDSYYTVNTPPYACSWNGPKRYTSSIENIATFDSSCPSDPEVVKSVVGNVKFTKNEVLSTGGGTYPHLVCTVTDLQPTVTNSDVSLTLTFERTELFECPASNPIGPLSVFENDLDKYCYRLLVDEPEEPPCDDPLGYCDPDEPEEPPCDDIIGNCKEPPKCVSGGGGSRVCKADPDEKCWLDAFEHTQCEEGCGFLNDDFFCMTEPTDNPDFDKCKFTFNGYACPSEPNDDITDPEKPLPDMVKKDFKDVNLGVETRQDKTNDLLETQLSADKNNTDAIKGAIDGMNKDLGKKLDGIDDTLGAIGKSADNIDKALNPENLRDIPQPESWYESKYEDGIGGVWAEHSDAIRQTPIFTFLDQFTFAPSGTQPDWTFNFNLGALGNYGTKQLEVPSFIWAFIRLVVLLGATFTARRLIFGG